MHGKRRKNFSNNFRLKLFLTLLLYYAWRDEKFYFMCDVRHRAWQFVSGVLLLTLHGQQCQVTVSQFVVCPNNQYLLDTVILYHWSVKKQFYTIVTSRYSRMDIFCQTVKKKCHSCCSIFNAVNSCGL